VFTLAGPAYVKFNSPHLLGCNDPWISHFGWTAFRTQFPKEWLGRLGMVLYKSWWIRQATSWTTQAETAKLGLHRRLRIPLSTCHVVTNTCGDHYRQNVPAKPFPVTGKKVRILCFSAPYWHKNLQIIPAVARELTKRLPNTDFEFVLTLPSGNRIWQTILQRAEKLSVQDRIVNVGKVDIADGPALYQSCDISFLPTLLETFSATYPESMAMGLPIVTTDLDFAHDVCQDAALYYSPRDAAQAAGQIATLLTDRELWEKLTSRGRQVVEQLPTIEQRYQMFIELIRNVVGSA